jgi:hypothetical protein
MAWLARGGDPPEPPGVTGSERPRLRRGPASPGWQTFEAALRRQIMRLRRSLRR